MRIMEFAGRLSMRIMARYASVLMDGHAFFFVALGCAGSQEVMLRQLDSRGKGSLVVLFCTLKGRSQVERDPGYYRALASTVYAEESDHKPLGPEEGSKPPPTSTQAM